MFLFISGPEVLIYSLSIISADGSVFSKIILDYNILFLITVVSGILLVSNLKLLNFKFKSLKFKGNRRRFFILFISIPSLVLLGVYAIPLILSLYVLISIFTFYKFKTKQFFSLVQNFAPGILFLLIRHLPILQVFRL